MHRLELSPLEVEQIRSLLATLTATYDSVSDPELLREASVWAQELPRRLRAFLNGFRLVEEPPGYRVISGYPIDDERIGLTPEHWRARPQPSPALAEEILLVLCSSLLGDVMGWATQQDGNIVHELCPIRGHEHDQLGIGCEELLEWHTEDAFHPYRGDYVGLLCLRNPGVTATLIATMDQAFVEPELRARLFERNFTIRPDGSHQRDLAEEGNGNGNGQGKGHEQHAAVAHEISYRQIERLNSEPEKIAVLFGDPAQPYLRLDPLFMEPVPDPTSRTALEKLMRSLEQSMQEVVLAPGDVLFIDNYRTVHGRKPFHATFDGRDRWLKRVNVTRDLRKSRDARAASESRVIL